MLTFAEMFHSISTMTISAYWNFNWEIQHLRLKEKLQKVLNLFFITRVEITTQKFRAPSSANFLGSWHISGLKSKSYYEIWTFWIHFWYFFKLARGSANYNAKSTFSSYYCAWQKWVCRGNLKWRVGHLTRIGWSFKTFFAAWWTSLSYSSVLHFCQLFCQIPSGH